MQQEAPSGGVQIEPSWGCSRGQTWDMIAFGPPMMITKAQIDGTDQLIAEALAFVEKPG